jgi:hypothetical protein
LHEGPKTATLAGYFAFARALAENLQRRFDTRLTNVLTSIRSRFERRAPRAVRAPLFPPGAHVLRRLGSGAIGSHSSVRKVETINPAPHAWMSAQISIRPGVAQCVAQIAVTASNPTQYIATPIRRTRLIPYVYVGA